MVHRRWVPYCHSPLFSDLLHPEDGPSQGPHELPANPIHSSYGRLALGTAFTAGYKLPSARAITRSIAVHTQPSTLKLHRRLHIFIYHSHLNLSDLNVYTRVPVIPMCRAAALKLN